MVRQNALTLITPVKADQADTIHGVLHKIRQELIDNKHEVFEELGTIHYARWVLLEAGEFDGEYFPCRLVFVSDFDGPPDMHLYALSNVAASFIDRIYSMCEGYPAPEACTPETRSSYLQRWVVPYSATFAGAPGRSLEQIRKESRLRNFIRAFLDSRDWGTTTAQELHKKIQQTVLNQPEFHWVKEPFRIPKKNWFALIPFFLVVLLMLPFIIPLILYIEFFHERKDIPLGLTPSQVNEAHMRKLETYEDLENQNQFTQVLTMKPSRARLFFYFILMWFSRQLIKNLFVDGKLMNIPTIHFARWVMFDNNKRMIFFSNFDGSWQQYLGDFIDKSWWGLTAIWSNSRGFPKTKFTFWGGALDEEHFLAWSRYYERPTHVWYCAYPHLSIKNIVNNTHIRVELMKNLSESGAKQFLQRF